MYAEDVGTYIANVGTCVSKNESQETFVIACQNMFVGEIPKLNENMCFQQILRKKNENLHMEN